MKASSVNIKIEMIFILLLCVTLSSAQLIEENTCPVIEKCDCNKTFGFEIKCPQSMLKHIFVDVQKEEQEVYLQSHALEESVYLNWAALVERQRHTFCFTSCPLLPEIPLETYLKKIKVDRIRSLHFLFVNSDFTRNVWIAPNFLSGLIEIEKFDFRIYEGLGYFLTPTRVEPPVDIFRDMTMLTELRLRFPNARFPAGLFQPLKNLVKLRLNDNKLTILKLGLLQSLTKLRVLELAENLLDKLNKDMFIGLASLQQLDLGHNKLNSLDSDVFYHLTALAEVNLKKNYFYALPDGLFANNKALRVFHLTPYSYQKISYLPKDLFANLTEFLSVSIDGASVALPENTFSGSKRIREIIVRRFKMEILPKNLFKDQEALEILNLKGNKIAQIEDESFPALKRLSTLYLSENRLRKLPG